MAEGGTPRGALRRVDARFLLPELPQTAVALVPEWAAGLRRAGVRVIEPGEERPDLVVAPAERRDEALRIAAPMLLLEGKPPLRRPPGERRYLPLPDPAAPVVVADLSQREAAARALELGTSASGLASAAKQRAGRELARLGLLPPLRAVYAVTAPGGTVPALVRQAERELGARLRGWFLLVEPGSERKRCVFHLLTGPAEPDLVLKFSRLRDDRHKAEREERGLAAARAAGAVVAAHAPRLLGGFEHRRHHATLQTAAEGRTLARLLAGRATRTEKLARLDLVVTWLEEVARVTAGATGRGEEEALELAAGAGLPAQALAAAVSGQAAVFQHGDLADGNVLVSGRSFTAVDWELARPDGWPLFDLVYLLVNALPVLDGARGADEHVRHLAELFRGHGESSAALFGWLRRVAGASGVAPDAVPGLVTLCLLSYRSLRERLHGEADLERPNEWPVLERLTAEWLADPLLGPSWRAWTESDAATA